MLFERFAARLSYVSGQYDSAASLRELNQFLATIETGVADRL